MEELKEVKEKFYREALKDGPPDLGL